jgi:hypothetical protein
VGRRPDQEPERFDFARVSCGIADTLRPADAEAGIGTACLASFTVPLSQRASPKISSKCPTGGPEPSTLSEAIFRARRLQAMRTPLSAAYKAVNALLMKGGAQHSRSGHK